MSQAIDLAYSTQHDPRRVEGRQAGQREDLVARLRDLAGAYPAGQGILKEFLQNADDAGATWVRFTLDLRDHPRDQLPDDRMVHLLGPALLVESDQSFTDRDLENIKRIGSGGKTTDAGKTGRFGLGFNTVYSVTDYPSFATRDLIRTFDPFFDTVAKEGQEPGYEWDLDVLWTEAPGWPTAFGIANGVADLDNRTIFRLPLRTADQTTEDRIVQVPMEPSKMRRILEGVKQGGDKLLLFLRSVLAIHTDVILPGGQRQPLVSITTRNADAVLDARQAVLPISGLSSTEALDLIRNQGHALPSRVYQHVFLVDADDEHRDCAWLVCQGQYVGDDAEVFEAARDVALVREKPVPLAGAAVRIEHLEDGHLLPLATEPTLCCTLPLPELQRSSIPLVINARWSLESSRSTIRFRTDSEGDERIRVRWNRALAEHVVPEAIADLFEELASEVSSQGAAAMYRAWPVIPQAGGDLDDLLCRSMYEALSARSVVRVEQGARATMDLPSNTKLPPGEWKPSLVAALIADGFALASPRPPKHVLTGLNAVGEGPEVLEPREVRRRLGSQEAQVCPLDKSYWSCLRSREDLLTVAAFCSEQGEADLDGLPLALTEDGLLRTFGDGDNIYLADHLLRSLYGTHPEWFVDAELAAAAQLAEDQSRTLWEMSPSVAIEQLQYFLGKRDESAWNPTGQPLPNEAWLIELLCWFSGLPGHSGLASKLDDYAMVPGADGRLHQPGKRATPLLPASGSSPAPLDALIALGVPVVRGSPAMLAALEPLVTTGNVWRVTAKDVVGFLAEVDGKPLPASSPHRTDLLSWLAREHRDGRIDPETRARLLELALWPTNNARLAKPSADDSFLPEGYEPPPGFPKLDLLQTGPDQQWRPLLEWLEVKPLGLRTWLSRVFIPSFEKLDDEARRGALRWLRDNGVDAMQGQDKPSKTLRDRLQALPLIEQAPGGFAAPRALYHPEAQSCLELLGPIAHTPDMATTYKAERAQWLDFFAPAGLALIHHPRTQDIVARVKQLLAAVTPDNADDTEKSLVAVYEHLVKIWAKEQNPENSWLAKELGSLEWIPTIQTPPGPTAAFQRPEKRFMLPSQAYPARLLHRGASQVAFAGGVREDAQVRQALGMPVELTAEQALAHFQVVRERWEANPAAMDPEAVGVATRSFYNHVGRLANRAIQPGGWQNVTRLAAAKNALADTRGIWDPNSMRFWKGEHCFAEDVGRLAGFRVQVILETEAGKGLDALGRRPRLEAQDYVSVLREFAAAHPDQPLDPDILEAAIHCWHRLADEPDALVPDLPVPTESGVLRPVERTLVDDATYWRERLADADLPWLHGQIPVRAALHAGACRVSVEVREQRSAWNKDSAGETRDFCAQRTQHLHSDAFARGVQRLLAQKLDEDELPPEVEDIHSVVALELTACSGLRAGLVCPGFGVDEPLGEEQVSCLLDADVTPPVAWVAAADLDDFAFRISSALSRRLTTLVTNDDPGEIIDSSHLEAILRCSTDSIDRNLDRRGVPSMITEPVWEEDVEDLSVPPETLVEMDEPTAAPSPSWAPDTTTNEDSDDLPAHGHGGGDGGGPLHRSTPPGERPPRVRRVLTDRVRGSGDTNGDHPAGPPVVPHQGQSAKTGRRKGQWRSYMVPEGAGSEKELDPATIEGRRKTERAALEYVDEIESRPGWKIVAMDQFNEGYDREITPAGEDECRFVEVKGLRQAWDARGVQLTPAELRCAEDYGDRYWVYVVEYARDPERRRLYRIRNVAGRVTSFCLDDGWAALDEPEDEILQPEPGRLLYEGDQQIGTIIDVTKRGEALRLELDKGDGERLFRNWNPARHRVEEAET